MKASKVSKEERQKWNYRDWTTEELMNFYQIGVIGNKGAGKTYAVETIAELLREERFVIVVDIINAIKNHKRERVRDFRDWLFIDIDFKAQELTFVELFKKLLKKLKDKKKILCLCMGELSYEELRASCEALFSVLLKMRNYALIVDEIQEIIPQHRGSVESAEKLFRTGRNKKIYPVIFTSQRIQFVDKRVLALTDAFMILKIDYFKDADMVAYQLGIHDLKNFRRSLKRLKVGEGYISYWGNVYKLFVKKDKIIVAKGGRKPSWWDKNE